MEIQLLCWKKCRRRDIQYKLKSYLLADGDFPLSIHRGLFIQNESHLVVTFFGGFSKSFYDCLKQAISVI